LKKLVIEKVCSLLISLFLKWFSDQLYFLPNTTNAGTIDILAISNDRKKLLVVELKRGRVSDVVVGQLLRYMGLLLPLKMTKNSGRH